MSTFLFDKVFFFKYCLFKGVEMLKKLIKYIEKNGYAEAAFKLGYKDTSALKKWISRNEIPKKQISNVEKLLK